ncbi:MAG: phage portal protein [Phycisphaerales bacterium]
MKSANNSTVVCDMNGPAGISAELLDVLIAEHVGVTVPRLSGLWAYYRNPMERVDGVAARGGRGYRLAQERGLPPRLTGRRVGGVAVDDRALWKREIVIENDIAWRIGAMVDFLFGKPVRIVSLAADTGLARRIEDELERAWACSGGQTLMQDMALLGHVYGYVDLLVREGASESGSATGTETGPVVELIEPTRGMPVVSSADYRLLDGFALHFERPTGHVRPAGSASFPGGEGAAARRASVTVTELFTAHERVVWVSDGRSGAGEAGGGMNERREIERAANRVSPGRVPIAHVQNVSQPFAYAGIGEVEPLVPLQDELNTRLSDRACRVTMQSFKMYLAKGVETFDNAPVTPGQYWVTDNPDASIEAFGGDAASPSEESHIAEIREVLDKASAVPPLATGVVRARVGNLTSESALRLTLQGLIARTERKRLSYGRGIAEACELVLSALDIAGTLTTRPEDRAVRIEWADPLENLKEAGEKGAMSARAMDE